MEISWLTRVNSWIDEGLRLNAVGDDVKIKNAGTEIGLIRNNTLLATNYSSGFSGTPVGDAVNGCRIFKNGSQIFVKRVPDLSGLTQLEENYLTISHLAHCTEKHGADVTDEALKYRTQTGIAPNGESGNPVSGTRFYSNAEIKACISQLGPGTPVFNANLNSSNDRSIIIKYNVGMPLGEGYRIGGSSLVGNIYKVTAIWWKDNITGHWFLRTMYPVLE